MIQHLWTQPIEHLRLLTTFDKLSGKDSLPGSTEWFPEEKTSSLKTITFNNKQAFKDHEEITELSDVKTLFTKLYTSKDKDTIENRNRVIRM